MVCSTVGVELVAEEVVDAPDDAHRVGDELAVVDVEEAVLADAGPCRDGLLDADAEVVRHLAPEPVQVEAGRRRRGRSSTPGSPTTGTAFTGSRCVITNRASG